MNQSSTKRFDPSTLPAEFMKSIATEQDQVVAKHFLLPGQFMVSKEPTLVSTILGSCVSVCLWDARLKIGGINHYLLPEGETHSENMRYGNIANAVLLEKLLDLGCSSRTLEARLFGGSYTFATVNLEQSLGARNIEVAIEFLRKNRIPILEKDTSGRVGRKVLFNTGDGTTSIKLLTTAPTVVERTTNQ